MNTGCIGSAGYVCGEVQQDCIRLFEKGIRTEAVDGSTASAFIVFSPDSTRLELFFSDEQPNEILERRGLPSGGYAWNVEDDDTKNVRFIDGLWTISQRDKVIYREKRRKPENNSGFIAVYLLLLSDKSIAESCSTMSFYDCSAKKCDNLIVMK